MEKNSYKNSEFKKWLDILQQESWQLELIISGFSVFGLISALDYIKSFKPHLTHTNIGLKILSTFAILSVTVLIINLVIHVIFRGLWIGAIGLRYVSGEIDYKSLNYTSKFRLYLQKKVGSFDKYIQQLEKYCSIMFAISFLLIFYILSVFIFLGIFILFGYFGMKLIDYPTFSLLYVPVFLTYLFGLLLVFIDFVTQGFLKRHSWLSKIYYPFYIFFNFIGLSFIYRPLVYNFLDHKFGKRLALFLIPFYLGIMIVSSLYYNHSNYLPDFKNTKIKNYNNANGRVGLHFNYMDALEENDLVKNIAIESKIINTNYLYIFIAHTPNLEELIYTSCETLKPEKDKRGLRSKIGTRNLRFTPKDGENLERFHNCFKTVVLTTIDSTSVSPDYIVSKNKKEQLGYETYIDISNLSKGKHILTATLNSKRKAKKDEEAKWEKTTYVKIPFWYYPK